MSLLTSEQIEAHMQKLDVQWALVSGTTLELTREFPDFVSALAFVNQLGELAEAQQHHPDVQLSYGKVVVRITTHSDGGLTKKDFTLAEAIS